MHSLSTDRLDDVASLDEFYAELTPLSVVPGWNAPAAPLWHEPRKSFEPVQWRYAWAKKALDVAGRLIDTSVAERRNLVLSNPQAGFKFATTRTMVGAYQMVLPGERARSHRHMPNALRVIMDAEPGTTTTVDGVAVPMLRGDVLLTPGMCWHGHGNESSAPAYWIDILDVPLVDWLEPMFYEDHPAGFEPVLRVDPASPLRFAWTDSARALEQATPEASGRFGRQIALDRATMPSFGLFMMALDAGRPTTPLQTTANNIYVVMEGRGISNIDGTVFEWERGDIFAAPAWRTHHHQASEDAILFRSTDEPVLKMLGYLR
jgi:gentisate 1,2-dioxygenase